MGEQDVLRVEVAGGYYELEGPRDLIEFLRLLDKPFTWLNQHGFELVHTPQEEMPAVSVGAMA